MFVIRNSLDKDYMIEGTPPFSNSTFEKIEPFLQFIQISLGSFESNVVNYDELSIFWRKYFNQTLKNPIIRTERLLYLS